MGLPKSNRFRALRAWMKQTKTRQTALARLLGVSDTQICLVFKGERHFSIEQAERLSDLAGIPVEKLLTDEEAVRLLKVIGKRMNAVHGKSNETSRVV